MIDTERINIGPIPAIIWGPPSQHLVLAVHGNMSHKADTVIELLAGNAVPRGYQVLSFDLPEHGDRKADPTPCKAAECVRDLETVMEYACARWNHIGLFGCSMGAYFSLLAYRDCNLEQCLFLSPVVDMERLIESMMSWSNVTPDQLREQGEICSCVGQMLYWDYYCYVKAHPIDRWTPPTRILYGEQDNLCERETVERFALRFSCGLEIVPGGEHFFHTEEQLTAYRDWLDWSFQ